MAAIFAFRCRACGIKTRVRPRRGAERPSLALEDIAHPLRIDWHQGIAVARAQTIAEAVMHGVRGS
jgi:hypothetical protein